MNDDDPTFWKDITLGYVGHELEGGCWEQEQRYRIIRIAIVLYDFIEIYAKNMNADPLQKIAVLKAAMEINSLLIPIHGDTEGMHIDNAFANIELAKLYCEALDTENALLHTEIAVEESIHHTETMNQTGEDGSNYYPWQTPRNLCWILWEDHLIKPQFDPVRNEERFRKCMELLKEESRELK